MNISIEGIDLIKKFEGCKLTAYKCSRGVWTIGIGSTIFNGQPVKEGQTITLIEAFNQFDHDIAIFENAVNSLVKSNINQYQFDSLVSFVYNIGIGNFKKSTLLKLVNSNPNDPKIADEFAKWIYANSKVITGLKNRRLQESNNYFKK